MQTYSEIVYMCLDELKLHSGDSDFNQDHILFLADKLRLFLLNRKYEKAVGSVSTENMQEICVKLERVNDIENHQCSEMLLRSTVKIPAVSGITQFSITPNNVTGSSMINVVPFERFKYLGNDKWGASFIYATRGTDGYVYLKSSNPQFQYLEEIKVRGVFEDSREAAKLECCSCGEECDIMDLRFPLEANLVTLLIQSVVQELSGQRYMNKDKQNNDADDMAGMAGATPRNINRQYVQQ